MIAQKTVLTKIVSVVLAAILVIAMSQYVFAGEGESEGGSRGGNSGGMQAESDAEVQAVLDETAGKFIQEIFTDPDSGLELEYSLAAGEEIENSGCQICSRKGNDPRNLGKPYQMEKIQGFGMAD